MICLFLVEKNVFYVDKPIEKPVEKNNGAKWLRFYFFYILLPLKKIQS